MHSLTGLKCRPHSQKERNNMTRKFKALGLAVFATLAMSAFMASTASATEFTAAKYPVEYKGSQTAAEPHVFKADTFETTCENAEFSGTLSTKNTTATLTPVYTGCTSAGLNATVDMKGCDYLFHLPEGSATHVDATVDLRCEGAEPTITAGGGLCVIHVEPNQLGLSKVTLSNNHPNITAYAEVKGIKANLTDVGGFFCPFAGDTTVSTAEYTGHLTVSGVEPGTENPITIDLGSS
jgi:hypothetical protein